MSAVFSFSGSYIEHAPAGPAWLTTEVSSGLHLLSHITCKGIDNGLELGARDAEGLHYLILGMIATMESIDAMVDEWRQERKAAAEAAPEASREPTVENSPYLRGYAECSRQVFAILKEIDSEAAFALAEEIKRRDGVMP